jgi:hypothetical protein
MEAWEPTAAQRSALTPARDCAPAQVGGSAQAVIRDQAGQGAWFGPDGLAVPEGGGEEEG